MRIWEGSGHKELKGIVIGQLFLSNLNDTTI